MAISPKVRDDGQVRFPVDVEGEYQIINTWQPSVSQIRNHAMSTSAQLCWWTLEDFVIWDPVEWLPGEVMVVTNVGTLFIL